GSSLFVVAAGFSFLSKESALTLPATALALDIVTTRTGSLRARLGAALKDGRLFYGILFIAGGSALFYKLVLAPGTKVAFDLLSDPITNLPDSLRSYSLYLRKTLWPWPLIADLNGLFPIQLGTASNWGTFWNGGTGLATALGLGIAAAFLAMARRLKLVGIALGFYFMLALPVANLIPLNEPAAEHYAHLPLAALAVVFCGAAAALFRRSKLPSRFGIIAAAALLIVFAGASFQRAKVWLDSETLWTSVTESHEGSDRAWSNLGLVYSKAGDENKATAAYQRALAIGPAPQPRIVANLMQAMRSRGDLMGAAKAGREGLAAFPDNPLLLSLTGGTLVQMGQPNAALPLLNRIAALPNGDREAAPGWRKDRALAHALTGDKVTGERLLLEARRLEPSDPTILSSLGWLYMDLNRWVEADSVLTLAVAMPKASANAWLNHAVAKFRLGHVASAANALDEAEKRGAQIPPSLRQAVNSKLKE
ncbi:MAG: tetratricopeptide (TPR) repeat protein, partial [Candidatus Krumholzibacteriia bacterium]